ncbi:uncharacterized protein DEA37_0007307, partial [Paragonimus westermani]
LLGYSLECYVCSEVEGNWGSCITSVQRCEPSQDACQSFVEYKTPKFWTVLRGRRAFITKGCTTRAACEQAKQQTEGTCYPSKTRDWFCTHCCTDDRCNYQVPDYATQITPRIPLISATTIAFIWRTLTWR